MFTAFSLSKSEPLTAEELNWLHSMLGQYSMTMPGLWLQALPWTRFEFRWCPAMNSDNGVIGCFSPLHPGTIFLQPFENAEYAENPDGRVHWIEQIFTTIVHELKHAQQWKKSKIAYILCALPFLREFTLEVDANGAGKDAVSFAKRWGEKYDYIDASRYGVAEKIFPEEKNV